MVEAGRDRYIVAGCLKSNDKSRVLLLDSHGNLKSETQVDLVYKDAYGGIDRCVAGINKVFIMIHLYSQVSIVQVRDDALHLVSSVLVSDGYYETTSTAWRSDSELVIGARNIYERRGIAHLQLAFN